MELTKDDLLRIKGALEQVISDCTIDLGFFTNEGMDDAQHEQEAVISGLELTLHKVVKAIGI